MKKFFVIICAAMIFLTGCSSETPVEVKTEKVLTSAEALTIVHEGKISLSHEVMVYSNISGEVVEKFFQDGDEVIEGQKLFKIGSKESEAELLETKTKLTEAMTTLAKEISQKNPVEELQAEIATLEERVKVLEEESSSGMIYAPVKGQTGIKTVRLGATVSANETILTTIGKNNPSIIRFEVSPEEKKILMAGEPKVSLKFIDGMSYHRAGTLKFIDDKTVEATFENPEELLLLGNTVEIELIGIKIPDAILVPESAIQQREGENFVFIDSGKKAVLKKVSLGGKFGNRFIVNDGLKAGDSVVVEGLTNLREGTPLKSENKE